MEREAFEALKNIRAVIRDLVFDAELQSHRLKKLEDWVASIQYGRIDESGWLY